MNRGFAIISVFLFLVFSSVSVLADLGPCAVFPGDNPWNREIYYDPIHPQSNTFITNILNSGGDYIHPDFGYEYGIPWITVTNSQPAANVDFIWWPDESDPGPYPIPDNAPVEGNPANHCDNGGDCHVIVINTDSCILYELYAANYVNATDTWEAGNGAIFDLNSNALRPEGWTSADAAGLPIFPGLLRCDEVMAGAINHAIRFTINRPYNGFYVYPARHVSGGNTNSGYPVYGARMRLKANYDLSGLSGQSLVIATAMQHYGLMLADIGSNFYITGEVNPNCWDEDNLEQLKGIPGSAFEFVAYPNFGAPQTNHFTTATPTLSWSRITWAATYEIQIDDNSNMSSPLATFTTPANSAVVPLSLPDGRYYWRVRAQRADFTWGAYSPIETFTVDA